MKIKLLYILGLFILLNLTNILANEQNPIVEWAPFETQQGVSDSQLIEVSDRLQLNFLIKQKGYIKRSLLKGKGNEWVDIIYWESIEDAHNAANNAANSAICSEFFGLMVMADPANASEGIFHYRQIRTWD